jgi:phosphatidylglycerol:prolipoprotein diacylglycerol transferase
MALYLTFWLAGGLIGSRLGILVLRRRNALSGATLLALAAAWLGFLYGANVQFRLEHLGVLDALAVPPSQLLAGGLHVPLGLVVGCVFAAACCAALRAPWPATADALAVTGAAMMPIGRIGCLLNGCCSGVVCGAWAAPICWRFPSNTEVYRIQVTQGLILPTSPLTLPVHPLQIYFGVAGLVVLGVLLWLLRRGAPAGALLTTFLFLYPLAQLALEPLRARTPGASPVLMATILGATVVGSGITLALTLRRARQQEPLPAPHPA